MEVVEAGCSFERARKPRVLVRRWRGWGSSFDSPAERAQSVCICRAPWVDCVRMEEPYLHGERRQGGEESLERIKTCVDAKEIFFCRACFALREARQLVYSEASQECGGHERGAE